MDDSTGGASISPIFAVASGALRLSLLLNAVSCQVANLGVEIHSISKGITALAFTLKQVGLCLQDSNNVASQEARDKALQITESARMVFDEIEAMLDNVQKTDSQDAAAAPSIVNRFRTCFKRQRVTYLLAVLEFFRLGLTVMLQVLLLGRRLVLKSSPTPPPDELIAHERAETQNMIIVRYWAQQRLDRLWELSRQEALEAGSGESNNKEEERQSSPVKKNHGDSSTVTEPYKYPKIRLGVDTSLNAIEDSPKDMLQITNTFLDEILERWINFGNQGKRSLSHPVGQHSNSQIPKVYVSSDSDTDDGYSSDERVNTIDWRKPRFQETRQGGSRLRNQYSNYQASVESDPEDVDRSASKNMNKQEQTRDLAKGESARNNRSRESSDSRIWGLSEDALSPTREHERRPFAYSSSGGRTSGSEPGSPMSNHRYPESQSRSHNRSQSQPQPQPQSQQQSQSQLQPQYPVPVQSTPQQPQQQSPQYPPPSSARPIEKPRQVDGWQNAGGAGQPRSASSSFSASPRYIGTGFNSSLHPSQTHSTPSSYTGGGTFGPPPPYTQQPPSLLGHGQQPHHHHRHHHHHGTTDSSTYLTTEPHRSQSRKARRTSSTRETSKERHERYKNLRRSATKGIVGIGAIAGFMEALEAFKII